MRDEAAAGLVFAQPWRRAVAIFIDALIIVAAAIPLDLVLFGTDGHERESLALVMVVTAAYHIGFLIARSATPGKTAMGMCVVDREGYALRPDTAILRYVVYFIGGTIGIGTLASIVLILIDPRRRAVHERIAGTLVVLGRPREADRDNRFSRL